MYRKVWSDNLVKILIRARHSDNINKMFIKASCNPRKIKDCWEEVANVVDDSEIDSNEVKIKYNSLATKYRKIKHELKSKIYKGLNWKYYELFSDTFPKSTNEILTNIDLSDEKANLGNNNFTNKKSNSKNNDYININSYDIEDNRIVYCSGVDNCIRGKKLVDKLKQEACDIKANCSKRVYDDILNDRIDRIESKIDIIYNVVISIYHKLENQ
ncbi:hypothetical protein A0H76_2674 [Hepatospora eriocheir]|uniref:Myb/SANT-like DNA-binding domain-containing protein n=1 Tax=Hepatospora eriocheir TaxID=1081669 RepID=A0A1X0QJH3_9MICR|nr:hypothetical protein A0H76_2674 [Hepatospora eriocheir]